MGSYSHQLRYVFRTLLRSPVFTIITVATIAIGIGAHAAIFSIVAAVGLAVSSGLTRVMVSWLYGISPLDPLTYAAVSLGVVAAAAAASYLPARRVSALNQVEAPRAE